MKLNSSRRGSALLIVLGLLSFMIVSAVAFAAYMRLARLPSSYLRRTSASRQLVKAALSRAIDEIDLAIGNNPHPGLGDLATTGKKMNYWKNRIYIGTNQFSKVDKTVSVLTLEGLAFIPPSLVNEARYYSRLSSAAEWKQFAFDAGRYAFCAIDVSDCFDINRLAADLPRSSADTSRISLSYLFENYQHTTDGSQKAAEWDNWMSEFRTENEETGGFTYKGKLPLISVADMNLALGAKGNVGGFTSPFYNYLDGSGSSGFNSFGGVSEEYRVNSMNFVTDSWFPMSTATATAGNNNDNEDADEIPETPLIDIDSLDGQPFPFAWLNGGTASPVGTTLMNILSLSNKGYERIMNKISTLGMLALFDYLDADHIPLSLALPTTERIPMLCGLKPNYDAAAMEVLPPVVKGAPRVSADEGTANFDFNVEQPGVANIEVFQTVDYSINGTSLFTLPGIDSLFVYPFAHKDETDSMPTFSVDGRVTLFFTQAGEPVHLRTKASDDILHLMSKQFAQESLGSKLSEGAMSFPIATISSRSFGKDSPKSEEEAIEEITLNTQGAMGLAPKLAEVPMMRIVYRWPVTWVKDQGSGIGSYQPQTFATAKANNSATIARAQCGVAPLDKNGKTIPQFFNQTQFSDLLRTGAKPKLDLNLAIWVRITDRDQNTVDLVPAHTSDDPTFNGTNLGTAPGFNFAGDVGPLMLFNPKVSLVLDPDNWKGANERKQFDLAPKAVMVADPRYNHAPECWGDIGSSEFSKNYWLNNNRSAEKNGDIFLETSDQGYLQSIYELAFLPRFTTYPLKGEGWTLGQGKLLGNFSIPSGLATFNQLGEEANHDLMWSSYFPYGDGNSFDALGFYRSSRGYKINPYTSETNVLMAAFANTPMNWRVASTNDAGDMVCPAMTLSTKDFNQKFAWNNWNNNAKFYWDDLCGIAREFMKKICNNRQGVEYTEPPRDQQVTANNWKVAWENLWLNADDENQRFGDYELQNTDLWSVDRKFLYSYWREAFASRQQLFLIFVRSEPLMLGGGEMSKIPPQLGARAVALVWRDPAKTNASGSDGESSTSGYPHRTRILYYKPLE